MNQQSDQANSDDKHKLNFKMECLRLLSDGSGVGYVNGTATFVQGLLPGEIGEVDVYETKKKWQRARLGSLLQPSPERCEPPCTVFKECGGCQLQHMTYQETLYWKKQWVEDAITRIGKISAEVQSVLGMPNPWRYRNKVRLHCAKSGELGYYQEKSKALVRFKDCLLISERMNRCIRKTEEFLMSEYSPLDQPQALTFRENTQQKLLLLIEGGSIQAFHSPKAQKFFEKLLSDGLCAVWRTDPKGSLRLLWGDEVFQQTILDMTFNASPLSFLQVNSQQTNVLYLEVLTRAGLNGNEVVWDLYSGIGTLTLALARKAKKVTGIEENPGAVADALRNAKNQRDLGCVKFLEGKVELRIPEMDEQPDVVVLDPPRAGMHPEVVKRLIDVRPQRIVYVSCDPGTLARDLGLLAAGGYKIDSVQPVDMFPWTQHVETVVRLKTVT
jgi:23S rRNA (uracil1939-C5)-methyltransferase